MRSAVRNLFLALLLVFAQQAAFAHYISDDAARAKYGQDSKLPNSSKCDLHGLFTGVLGAVHSGPPPVLPQWDFGSERIFGLSYAYLPATFVASPSRGPPALL